MSAASLSDEWDRETGRREEEEEEGEGVEIVDMNTDGSSEQRD